jgi:hypothetical protein
MPSTNLDLLSRMAERLRPLLKEVVFVGGCATALLVTDEGAAEVRPTVDVDVIVVGCYSEYVTFSERLRDLGFKEDVSSKVLCRWLIDDMILDVMPADEKTLGFSNRWYRDAISGAREHDLRENLRIRVVTAPYFVATKLEAFRGRGKDDYRSSADLEDLISVIDGRAEIVDEVRAADDRVRAYITEQFKQLLDTDRFHMALPGYLPADLGSQGRVDMILGRMRALL